MVRHLGLSNQKDFHFWHCPHQKPLASDSYHKDKDHIDPQRLALCGDKVKARILLRVGFSAF